MSIDILSSELQRLVVRYVDDHDKPRLLAAGVLRDAILSQVVEVSATQHGILFLQEPMSVPPRFLFDTMAFGSVMDVVKFIEQPSVLQPLHLADVPWAEVQSLRKRFPWFMSKLQTFRWTMVNKTEYPYEVLAEMVVEGMGGFYRPAFDIFPTGELNPQDRLPLGTVYLTVQAKSLLGQGSPVPEPFGGPSPQVPEEGMILTIELEMCFSSDVTSIELKHNQMVEEIDLRACHQLRSLKVEGALPVDGLVALPSLLKSLDVGMDQSGVHRVFDMSVCPAGLEELNLCRYELAGSFASTPHLKRLRLMFMNTQEELVLPQLTSFFVHDSSTPFLLPLLLELLDVHDHSSRLYFEGTLVLSDDTVDLTPLPRLKKLGLSWAQPRRFAQFTIPCQLEVLHLFGIHLLSLTIPQLVKRILLQKCVIEHLDMNEYSCWQEWTIKELQLHHIDNFSSSLIRQANSAKSSKFRRTNTGWTAL